MIHFVRINSEYVNTLRQYDNRVQSNSELDKKETKPFLGILFEIGNAQIKYYVPLSSPKIKHHNMANSRDFHKIISNNGRLLAVLNFNNTLPVVSSLCEKIDISKEANKYVLLAEYIYCKNNEKILRNKALQFYNRFINNQLSLSEKMRSCDFTLLENVLQNYLASKKGYTNNSLNENATQITLSQEEQKIIDKIKLSPQKEKFQELYNGTPNSLSEGVEFMELLSQFVKDNRQSMINIYKSSRLYDSAMQGNEHINDLINIAVPKTNSSAPKKTIKANNDNQSQR